MAFWTAHWKFAKFYFLFWTWLVRWPIILQCLVCPGETYAHDLHADAIDEIRGHRVDAPRFLRSHEKRNARPIQQHLQLKRIREAPYGTDLDQFSVLGVRRIRLRLGVRRSGELLGLQFQSALAHLISKSLWGGFGPLGVLSGEGPQFVVTASRLMLGEAPPFCGRIDNVHGRRNDISATHLSQSFG